MQGGHWLGEKRRHSPRPRVGSAESSSDFGMCSPNVNQRPASTSAQLIYDQLVVVCVTKRSIVKEPREIPVGPSIVQWPTQRQRAFIDSDFKEKVTHLALAMNDGVC